MTLAHAFVALCVVWAISQLWIGLRRRSGDASKARDRGTLDVLIVVIFASIAGAGALALRDGRLAAHDSRFVIAGMAVMLAGLLLRWWSVRTLARFFTVDLAVHPGQTLVRRGPYRLLRHPSYTGAQLTVVGFGMGTGEWLPALIANLPIFAAFLWRIRVEERMLADAFPDAWPVYARETRRLIPFLW